MFYEDASFWVSVAFLVFLALIFRPVGRMLGKGLDQRSARIQSELDEALRLKEEVRAVLASYQRKQKEALQEAEAIVAHAQEEAERLIETAHSELEHALNKRIELAMQKISNYEASVLQELHHEAIDNALASVYTYLEKNNTPELQKTLVERSGNALNERLKNVA